MGAMKLLTFVIGISLYFTAAVTQEECEVEGILLGWSDSIVNYDNIDDNFVGITQTLQTKNVIDVTVFETEYLTSTLINDIISIRTKPEFKYYDERELGDRLRAKIQIICANNESYELGYTQYINDINTYAPQFYKGTYEFIIHGSIPQGFSLTEFVAINATDKDCSPDQVSFSIDEEDGSHCKDFEMSRREQIEKVTWANIYSRREIQAPFEKTYRLTATDRFYDDQKTTTATFKIKLLEDDTTLRFSNENYTISIQNNVVVMDELIEISEGIDENLKVAIEESEYSKYFEAKIDYLHNSIMLDLKDTLPKPPTYAERLNEIHLKLKATWKTVQNYTDVTVKTDTPVAQLCYLPGINLSQKSFENRFKLNDTFVGQIFKSVDVQNIDDIQCAESGMSKKYLDCNYDKTKKEFTVFTTKDFEMYEDNEAAKKLVIELTISCPYDEKKVVEFTQMIEDINNHDPHFDKSEYTYTFYNELPQSYKINLLSTGITVTDKDLTQASCIFKFEDDTDDLFETSTHSTMVNKTCSPLIYPRSTIKAPYKTTLTYIVQDNTPPSRNATAKININVVSDENVEFAFTQNKYQMKLHDDRKTIVSYDNNEALLLTNGFDSETTFEPVEEEYFKLFSINADPLTGSVTVNVKPKANLSSYGDIVAFEMKATWKDRESITELTVALTDIPLSHLSPSIDNVILPGFATFVLSSTIGIACIFTIVAIALFAMIYSLRRIYYSVKTTPTLEVDVETQKGLPEKWPLP